jgi:hypothetical protein
MITLRRIAMLGGLCCLVSGQASQKPQPWDFCSGAPGEAAKCGFAQEPRPLEYFLHPGTWPESEWFSGVDSREKMARTRTQSIDLGRLGRSKILDVEYHVGDADVSCFLLAEHSPGLMAPLLQWEYDGCGAEVYASPGGDVLVYFVSGGRRGIDNLTAWVGSPKGPVRLDIEEAIRTAVAKAVDIEDARTLYSYAGIALSVDWTELHCETRGWSRGSKQLHLFGGGDSKIDIWFSLRGAKLEPKRVEWQTDSGIKHWP